MNLIKSYLRSQVSYVQVGEAKSAIIKNRTSGIGQGMHIAGQTFNISSIDMTSEERIPVSTRYSDDDLELVVADTNEELLVKVEVAMRDKKVRVNRIGLKIQEDQILYKRSLAWRTKIIPTTSIKHLGCMIQHDLKPNCQVELTYIKMKQAAARIRSLEDLPKKWKLSAYYCWAQTALSYKTNSCLPFLTSSQINKLQIALNHAIRISLSCPLMTRGRNGKIKYPSKVKLRRRWRILTVVMLKTIDLAKLS